MIIYLIGMTFLALDFQKGKFVLLSLGIIAALYLIDKLKLSIIPKPTVGQKNSNFIFILIGAIFISILGSLAIEFSQIMEPPENQDKSIFLLAMVISLIIFGGVIYWFFRKNKKAEIDLIKLLIWGFSILMLLYLVDFIFFRRSLPLRRRVGPACEPLQLWQRLHAPELHLRRGQVHCAQY